MSELLTYEKLYARYQKLQAEAERMRLALSEYQRFNNIGNDVKSYLWSRAERALGCDYRALYRLSDSDFDACYSEIVAGSDDSEGMMEWYGRLCSPEAVKRLNEEERVTWDELDRIEYDY